MEKVIISIEELNAAIRASLNAALDAREGKKGKEHLNRKAVAERLHVDMSTLWRWQKAGYLVPVKIGGRVWYLEEDVERLERGEMTP